MKRNRAAGPLGKLYLIDQELIRQFKDERERSVDGMPFCPSCGRQLGEEDRFCPSCGQALPVETAEELIPEAPRGAEFERGPLLIKHLRRDEKVLWSGKPVKTAFLFSGAGGGGLVGVLIGSRLS